jgi:glucose-1-phosphate cytidylyltransferase
MKVVILAGGYGTRISEESALKPKPMIQIGGRPILWHIMKIYSHYGLNEFVICLGYKGYMIKEYFANYFMHMSDVTFDIANNEMHVHRKNAEPWKITLIDTGEDTMTGGRLLRVRDYVDDSRFCFTYGDGVSDVNIQALIDQHDKSGDVVTLTAISPPSRFGAIKLTDDGHITEFSEKPNQTNAWINGGFFVMEPEIFDYLKEGDTAVLEGNPMQNLAIDNKLGAYKHAGFWHSMDTLRDKNNLNQLWKEKAAPWKIW